MRTFPSLRSKRQKFIVTGGAGFIGSHIVEMLLERACQVIVIDDLSSGDLTYIPRDPLVQLVHADIGKVNSLHEYAPHFFEADGVFHVAAQARIQPSIADPRTTFFSNVVGTFHVLEAMRQHKVRHIVYSASSSSYGKKTGRLKEDLPPNCLNPYASTKLMCEELIKSFSIYDMSSVCLKYFNVYGPRSPTHLEAYSPVIGLFFKQALMGEKITVVGDGMQKRDFTYIDDVVDANLMAMDDLQEHGVSAPANGKTLNIGTGTNYTILEIAEMVKEAVADVQPDVEIVHIDPRPGEARETLANNTAARLHLGWEPGVSLEDSIKQLKKYYMEQFYVA